MASNDLEVLDPVVPVEKVMEAKSGNEIDRRHFFAAMGVAGVAAGAALFSGKSADAQQPSPNGYAQVDVINFLLNIKYLKATLYSYVTQGADLPGSSYVTLGTGVVFNQPAKVTFSSQQITDIFNEMYYDELNQLIALRAAQGAAVAPRQTMNLLGTGTTTTATTTLNQSQVIALSRLLEDLSATAFAAATTYLTGTNLTLAAQALASDGQHAGLIRLISIQNNVQYEGTQFASVSTSSTAQAAVTFTGTTQSGNPVILATLGANLPAVGSTITGIGIPPGSGAVIKSITSTTATTFTAIPDKTSILKNVSSVSNLQIGQPITGTYVPAGSYISAIGTNTVTISVNGVVTNTSGAATVAPTGFLTSGSPTVTGVSSTSGLIVGQVITGTGIPASTTISAFSSSAATITLSANATANSQVAPTGTLTSGSPTITALSSVTGLVIGQPVTGTGIPAATTITAITATTLTMSANATASGTGVTVNSPTTYTLSSPTTDTYTIAQSQVTIAGNATFTGLSTFYVVIPDNEDVEPVDPGVAATSALGPQAVSGTSPALYQGFFNTAGAGTSSSTSTPAGFAFARTFQQVLAILYGYNATNSIISTSNYEGGFYPVGVTGSINSAI